MTHKPTSFTDTKGRVWEIPTLSLWHIKKLNGIGIELEEVITTSQLWDSTDSALITCGGMLWCWCEGQHECTEDDFFMSFAGETFEEAQGALLVAIANFIPTKRREAVLSMAKAVQRVKELMPKLTADQVQRIESILSESVTSGLERLASQTQTPSA